MRSVGISFCIWVARIALIVFFEAKMLLEKIAYTNKTKLGSPDVNYVTLVCGKRMLS